MADIIPFPLKKRMTRVYHCAIFFCEGDERPRFYATEDLEQYKVFIREWGDLIVGSCIITRVLAYEN